MSKYKEQMNKICVDNDMKKRIIKKIKEIEAEEKKESIYKMHTFYRYGGIMAACCAFVVTYNITINRPEIMSEKYVHKNDEQYSVNDENDGDSEISEDNYLKKGKNEFGLETADKKAEFNTKYVEIDGKKDGKKDEILKNEYTHDDSSDVSDKKINNEEINNEEINNKEENIDYFKSEQVKKDYNLKDNTINNNSVEDIENKIQDNKIYCNDNNVSKAASYDDNLINNSHFEYSTPDLGKYGFDMIYLNHISMNEAEIMYSDNDRNVWIKIYNKENNNLEDYYKVIGYTEYNGRKVTICSDSDDNNHKIVYSKGDYFYCIWSDFEMNDTVIENILKNI